MSKINQYVGLDVSLKETSICVIDDAGKIVWHGRTDTTPEAIAAAVKRHAPHAARIGLERRAVEAELKEKRGAGSATQTPRGEGGCARETFQT